MPKLNTTLQILDLRDAVANVDPADCETLALKFFEANDQRLHKKQCIEVVDDFDDLKAAAPEPKLCTDPASADTPGCDISKDWLHKPAWEGCSSSKNGLDADSFVKAVCKYPPAFYSICVREEDWPMGTQENPSEFHQNPCKKDSPAPEKASNCTVINFQPVCRKDMTCRMDMMSPGFFQCGTIEENAKQKQNKEVRDGRLKTGTTYDIKCPTFQHLIRLGVAHKSSFFSSDTGCYMLLKSYPSLDLDWPDEKGPLTGFNSYSHAAATCRQWHPDAHVLQINNYQEFVLLNAFLKRELGSPTMTQRSRYNFLLRNNVHGDKITVVCDGEKAGSFVRYLKAKISRHFNEKRAYAEEGAKCTFWSYGLGKCDDEFITDLLTIAREAPCHKAFGLICEYNPDCPIDVRVKPDPVPRSEQVCKTREWPQFRHHRRELKKILDDNGISSHDTV